MTRLEEIRQRAEAATPGADYAGLIEAHDDIDRTLAIVRDAYGWQVMATGRLCGLVAGDMGYASTSIVLGPEDRFAGDASDTVRVLTKHLQEAEAAISRLKAEREELVKALIFIRDIEKPISFGQPSADWLAWYTTSSQQSDAAALTLSALQSGPTP